MASIPATTNRITRASRPDFKKKKEQPLPAFFMSPGMVRAGTTYQVMRFLGSRTSWQTHPPTFTASGLADVVVGSVMVVNDTEAVASVTYPSTAGTIIWSDSTTAAMATQAVNLLPVARRRSPERLWFR
jgi:hypothetical protein